MNLVTSVRCYHVLIWLIRLYCITGDVQFSANDLNGSYRFKSFVLWIRDEKLWKGDEGTQPDHPV